MSGSQLLPWQWGQHEQGSGRMDHRRLEESSRPAGSTAGSYGGCTGGRAGSAVLGRTNLQLRRANVDPFQSQWGERAETEYLGGVAERESQWLKGGREKKNINMTNMNLN